MPADCTAARCARGRVEPRRRHRPHGGGLHDAGRHQVGQERRRDRRAGGAVRRSVEARPVRRAHQVAAGEHEPAAFPSERPLLRGGVRHLVGRDRREVRSGEHRTGARREATSSTTPAGSTTTAPRARKPSSRSGGWGRRPPRRRRSADPTCRSAAPDPREQAVVDRWCSNGIERTAPPQACTSRAPTIASGFQSPPLTSTSGRHARISASGVSASNGVTMLTDSSAASTAIRSARGLTGRSSPLPSRFADASEFTPTTRLAPSARACAR